ncbi:RNA polymerase sigma factor [Fusibacter ferrireducens]|uniref:RNA polymerase sigma factor n=1 Tax=Fusibacter ferrireducens TaxID=2785058 RepID=A0ABR9ZQS2_9FIRM|nr:RNA polymerase sigma factor [Fusibacter ferrireducens]MBF4692493.1 RNA polymerase sigma factor [Fusibacter ferrireducens]
MEIKDITQLINDHGKDIYNFCRHLTKDKEEADELYQDTFLKALELCDKIDQENNPKSYLLSIAAKLWRNRRRKFAWRKRIVNMEHYRDDVDFEPSLSDLVLTPEDHLMEKENLKMVIRAVNHLKEEYRVPMYLCYAAEIPLKEISRILKLPEGTVKSRLYKGRHEVKQYLEVNGYGR